VLTERRYEGMLSNMFLDLAGEELYDKVSREISRMVNYAPLNQTHFPPVVQRPP
jgi:hypothetical protein